MPLRAVSHLYGSLLLDFTLKQLEVTSYIYILIIYGSFLNSIFICAFVFCCDNKQKIMIGFFLLDFYFFRHRHTYIQVCLLVALCAMSSIAVFVTWTVIYRKHVNIPPRLNGNISSFFKIRKKLLHYTNLALDIPPLWSKRAIKYAKHYHEINNINYSPPVSISNYNSTSSIGVDTTITGAESADGSKSSLEVKQLDNEKIYPSKYGNFIYKSNATAKTKLVCYYSATFKSNLQVKDVYPHLCTHLHVGQASIENNRIIIDDNVKLALEQATELKVQNKEIKVMIWVGGGGGSSGFPEMVVNHANRKQFIQSLKEVLETYGIDGVDLDWEFPSAYQRERQHFTQLLHEIRREYQREHRTYLLSVAAAAPEGIAFFSYDIAELNSYADYVNIMTYDFHFYTKDTPFTGTNSNGFFFF